MVEVPFTRLKGNTLMLRSVIEDAAAVQCGTGKTGWALVHPNNGSILVYADTKDEALAYKEAINDIPRQLRAAGFEVK
jgi:hypothetical protein